MKRWIIPIILLGVVVLEIKNIDYVTNFLSSYMYKEPELVFEESNNYKKDYDFMFVKETNEFIPYSYNDLLNITHTFLNNGYNELTFYCPSVYINCYNDLKNIFDSKIIMSEINNFISPFNTFERIKADPGDNGKITLSLDKKYDDEKITKINQKIDDILKSEINNSMSLKEKLKKIHDYIINNTKYDIEKNNDGESIYESDTAYGLFFEGHATCRGYADAYSLFLDRLGVKNFRVSSTTHIWNAVYYEDKWYHVDLTWDDPVSGDGKDYLFYTYFMVDTDKMYEEDKELTDHIFDKSVFLEFKN